MTSKEYFFDQVIKEALQRSGGQPVTILELGCGTAVYVPAIIKRYPEVTYVGVEPIQSSFKKAEQILSGVPRTKVLYQLGYDSIPGIDEGSFSVVISFSVLEHVKQLNKFMALCAAYVKTGGLVVHRYDLGHALYPSSLKERFHVWVGNVIPALLPERTFVRYVPLSEVTQQYRACLGVDPYTYTFHQVPDLKQLTKDLKKANLPDQALQTIYDWEFTNAKTFLKLPVQARERLFPSIAVWGTKV